MEYNYLIKIQAIIISNSSLSEFLVKKTNFRFITILFIIISTIYQQDNSWF